MEDRQKRELIDSLRSPPASVSNRLAQFGLDERPSLSDEEAAALVDQIESGSERLSADD
ncbi:hypothetical protein [Halobaculum sp. MBLA0143]|uniref:hypothetical protein n=1 Tax=Halobaculum sp. MBLA0143 TaxID=3079933 RepID=UPI0035252DF5